ncbi:CLUMA_CG005062, isoform A [Clunio marinus]|uniref:CLUMA_CG005062, isoform A n=1 Tax=Clunio marinus TaxID=568069 RepID=A0A1J1HTR4_9DIPT|nr:CLUMA_CG005062, isoform A [Clunio marinus]
MQIKQLFEIIEENKKILSFRGMFMNRAPDIMQTVWRVGSHARSRSQTELIDVNSYCHHRNHYRRFVPMHSLTYCTTKHLMMCNVKPSTYLLRYLIVNFNRLIDLVSQHFDASPYLSARSINNHFHMKIVCTKQHAVAGSKKNTTPVSSPSG